MKTPKGTDLNVIKVQGGKDYIQVSQRVKWFREEHPDWTIITEFIAFEANSALAKATIITPEGVTIATSHKYESKENFKSYREKAETGAVGRALALCGYGTEAALDLDDDEGIHIVDAPIEAPYPYGNAPMHSTNSQASQVLLNDDAGDYLVRANIGRPSMQGKKLKDVDKLDLQKQIEYWGPKKPTGMLHEFLVNAKAYLEQMK